VMMMNMSMLLMSSVPRSMIISFLDDKALEEHLLVWQPESASRPLSGFW
jgi:hypothetical protein